MRTTILSIGTEILFGQITNTNTVYLSQKLNELGHDVMYHYTVGDNEGRLADIMKMAFEDCDLILTTGGLGPTQDDLTKEVACEIMGDELVMMDDVRAEIKAYMESYSKDKNRKITENNWKQALLPSRATIFHNEAGTAPGFALEKDGKYIICMPGPPREMKRMFEKSVLPFLRSMSEDVIYYRVIRTFGIGESKLETELLDLIDDQTDPTLATYAKEGECSLRIASKRRTEKEAMEAVDEVLEQVKERVGKYIYSCDDEELIQVVGRKLIEKGLSVSAAESCTGGMFASALTDIPGISASFDRSLVTYSNEAKMENLGVNAETLRKHGAVSEETAFEMAEGIKKVSGSDICISVTGISGPDGGTEEKPVGLAYIGFIYKDRKFCREVRRSDHGRKWNRQYVLLNMLDMINKNI